MILTERLHEIAGTDPDQIAIRFKGERKTYAELNAESDALAQILTGFGVSRGVRVGLLLSNRPEFIVSLFGILKSGGTAVLMETHLKERELSRIIRDCETKIILTESRFLQGLSGLQAKTDHFGEIIIVGETRHRVGDAALSTLPMMSKEDEAICQTTSGVSGYPKIIFRSYDNLFQEINSITSTIGLSPEDKVLLLPPLYHAYGLMVGLLSSIYVGSEVILCERFLPGEVLRLIPEQGVTLFIGVPFMYELLCRTFAEQTPDLSSLRLAFCAGAHLPETTFREFAKRFGINPNPLYGLTETGVVTINLSGDPDAYAGKPIRNVDVLIMDDNLQKLPSGEEGEVVVRSGSTTKAYDNQPALSETVFVKGLFYTGDRGRIDEKGNLRLVGRKKALINVAGNKVDPVEVEQILSSHPKVKEAVVLGLSHQTRGEIVKGVVESEESVDPDELIRFCRTKLAHYKVPAMIEIVRELPKNATGKVLKKYFLNHDERG